VAGRLGRASRVRARCGGLPRRGQCLHGVEVPKARVAGRARQREAVIGERQGVVTLEVSIPRQRWRGERDDRGKRQSQDKEDPAKHRCFLLIVVGYALPARWVKLTSFPVRNGMGIVESALPEIR
jgi:hypothetical protein